MMLFTSQSRGKVSSKLTLFNTSVNCFNSPAITEVVMPSEARFAESGGKRSRRSSIGGGGAGGAGGAGGGSGDDHDVTAAAVAGPETKKVSMREVAKLAKVSVATVSMVLNDNPRISRATHM